MIEPWERQLMRKYGMAEGDYARMLEEQGGVCALCGKKPGRIRLAVDHDHKTGTVRALLHARCNRAIGVFEFSVDTLIRLIAYIQLILDDRRDHASR